MACRSEKSGNSWVLQGQSELAVNALINRPIQDLIHGDHKTLLINMLPETHSLSNNRKLS